MSKIHYPRAWVQVHIRLEDMNQPDPDRLITLPHPPQTLEVTRNKWSEADTFKAVVDLEDFPLDPRIIRGVTFEAFIADAGSLDPAFWEKQSHENFVRHAVFAGIVDEISTEIDDDWRKTTLKGRDYTAYLLDVETAIDAIRHIRGVNSGVIGEVDDSFGARSQERHRIWKGVMEVFEKASP